MGYVRDWVRLGLAGVLISVADRLTVAIMERHRVNVARALVRDAMLLPSTGAVTTKRVAARLP